MKSTLLNHPAQSLLRFLLILSALFSALAVAVEPPILIGGSQGLTGKYEKLGEMQRGRYGVDRFGRQMRQFAQNSQWQNGEIEIVWPDKLATAKPQFNP